MSRSIGQMDSKNEHAGASSAIAAARLDPPTQCNAGYAAIESPGDARDDWEFLRDLILAVSGSNGLHSVDDVFKRLAAEYDLFRGLTLRSIGDLGVPVMQTNEKIPALEREAERKKKGLIVG